MPDQNISHTKVLITKSFFRKMFHCRMHQAMDSVRCRAEQNNMEYVNDDLLFTISHIIETSSIITLKIVKQTKGRLA